jgi:predicted transcriptional regulator
MAMRLDDVLVRRLDEVATGRLDRQRLALAAGVMAAELGWSQSQRQAAEADLLAQIACLRPAGPLPSGATDPVKEQVRDAI